MTRGIWVGSFSELFGSDDGLEPMIAEAVERARRAPRENEGAKPYKTHLLGDELAAAGPFATAALHPRVLEVVQSYLGLAPILRAADIWLTTPSPGPAVQTQLWHRDGDDRMNVKLFVYLSEVTEGSGPFCFAPGTHPIGPIRSDAVDDGTGRVQDTEMEQVVPVEDWMILCGGAGTTVLADTCGYHKQLKPAAGERLLFMAQYTSDHPNWPPTITISGPGFGELGPCQRRSIPR